MKYLLLFIIFLSTNVPAFSQDGLIQYDISIEEREIGKNYIVGIADNKECLLFITGDDFEVRDHIFSNNHLYLVVTTCTYSGIKNLILSEYEYLPENNSWIKHYTDYTDLGLINSDCLKEFSINVVKDNPLAIVQISDGNSISYNLETNQKFINSEEYVTKSYTGLKRYNIIIKNDRIISK